MSNRFRRDHILRAAEGYLELGLPLAALAELARLDPADSQKTEALYLRGESLRALERYGEAVVPLRKAAEKAPGRPDVFIALGWCYKRLGRVDLAIEALESTLREEDRPAIIYYNLACYYSLAGQRREALASLATALSIDASYRDLVADESDFDPLRGDAEFQAMTGVVV